MKDKRIRIADLRVDHDLKQKDVAGILSTNRSTYSKWEYGINDIPIEKCNELANLFNCSMDYLLGLSNQNNKVLKSINLTLMCKRLLELRKEKHLSQQELGNAVGFHQRTYSHYEDGSRIPTTFKLYYLALYYNISFDYLVGKSNKKEII